MVGLGFGGTLDIACQVPVAVWDVTCHACASECVSRNPNLNPRVGECVSRKPYGYRRSSEKGAGAASHVERAGRDHRLPGGCAHEDGRGGRFGGIPGGEVEDKRSIGLLTKGSGVQS